MSPNLLTLIHDEDLLKDPLGLSGSGVVSFLSKRHLINVLLLSRLKMLLLFCCLCTSHIWIHSIFLVFFQQSMESDSSSLQLATGAGRYVSGCDVFKVKTSSMREASPKLCRVSFTIVTYRYWSTYERHFKYFCVFGVFAKLCSIQRYSILLLGKLNYPFFPDNCRSSL